MSLSQSTLIIGTRLLAALCLMLAVLPVMSVYSYAADEQSAVRVGYYENEVFQEGAGEGLVKTGYAYEYYRKLSEYTGWKYEYVYGSFSEMYEKLLNGEIDMLAGLAKTEERIGLIGYPDTAMGNETYSLVRHDSDNDITTNISSLSGKTIGVLDSAIAGVLKDYLVSRGISADIKTFGSYEDLFSAFDSRSVDILAAEGDGAYGRENSEVLFSFGASDYYMCVNIARTDLLEELNSAQNELLASEPNYINSLKVKYYPSSITSRAFSVSEKEWLENHNILNIGYLNNYMPYSDTDDAGGVNGLIKEYIPKMTDSLGIGSLRILYTGYDSYDDMISDLTVQKIDAAFPIGGGLYYAEESGIYQSNAVISSSTELVYKGEYTDKTDLCFAVNENNRMQYYYIKSNFPDAEIMYYQSVEECLEAVIAGSVDCTTLNGMRANDILRNSKYRELSMKRLSWNDDRCFGVRNGNDGLLRLFNRGVNIIGSEYAANIANRYSSALYTYTLGDMIQDNMILFVIICASVIAVVMVFLVRDSVRSKIQADDRKKAGELLEEKNKELLRVAQEAEEANRAKTYFLSTMSHDIRTPMNSILSMNEMVLRECDNEDILVYAGHIRASGHLLIGLINDILDFSKIEAGKLDIIPVDYELSSVLNDLVTMAQTKTGEKGLCLELHIDDTMPNYLHGDEMRIKQAVTNILTNAVKYTKEGTVTFSVGYDNIDSEPESIMLNISVEDTGIGIKEEDIGKLFAAFERIDEANNRNIEGTGLGITITQSLLELMGSSLKVSSEFGKGSIFSFSLKQKVISREPVGDYEAAFRRSISEGNKYREKFTAPDAYLLVVDDTPVNLTVFKNLLKRTKINIDTANSADECIACAAHSKYDIIFLDHMMPYKDGIEALKELRSLDDNPNAETPVICLTANAVSGMKEAYIAAGFDDYITKPIDPDELESAIIRYLRKDKIHPAETEETEKESAIIPDFAYNIDGIDVSTGIKHCGTNEAYIEAVTAFLDTADNNIAEIERYIKETDIRNLTVKVHALKSTARIIGAEKLSSFAETLEKAGNKNDTEFVRNNIGRLLSDYRSLTDAISPMISRISQKDMPVIPYEKLWEAYTAILEFSDALDYDSIEFVIKSLEKYSIPEDETEKLTALKKAVFNYDYEMIPDILKQHSLSQ